MFEDINDKLKAQIKEKIKEIALQIMRVDNLEYCQTEFSEQNWVEIFIPFDKTVRKFIILPSLKFYHQIFERQYLKAVITHPELFGTGKVQDVLDALKKIDSKCFPPDYTIDEFYEYLKMENMAYIIEITGSVLGSSVLRLDLFRDIVNNDYRGGVFHACKHFTIEDYDAISKSVKAASIAHWDMIILLIVKNFYSGVRLDPEKQRYYAISELDDKFIIGGYYKKQEIEGLYYLNTLVPKSHDNLSQRERKMIELIR